MIEPSLIIAGVVVLVVLLLTSVIITTFLRSVDAGEILLASRGRNLRIYRGPCKAMIVPVITQVRRIPAQAINVDIEITDQTADTDSAGRPAPVKVTVRASAIVSVGEDEGMVNTAANKFFSKSQNEQMSTLTDVLSSAGRRAINMQIAANGAAIAKAETEQQAAVRKQREAELAASQITQAQADADQNVIQQEADGRAQAARIKAIAEAEAGAIRIKAEALAA